MSQEMASPAPQDNVAASPAGPMEPSAAFLFQEMVFELAVKGMNAVQIATVLSSTPEKVAEAADEYLKRRQVMEADSRLVSARLDRYLVEMSRLLEDASAKPWVKLQAVRTSVEIESLRIALLGLAGTGAASEPIRYVVNGIDPKELR